MVQKCRALVFKAAEFYEVPPVCITAHTRLVKADAARHWVMRQMIRRLHMRRWQVALMFQRDLRRVRRSVLGV
jgi:AraC-like DNA-binding protein